MEGIELINAEMEFAEKKCLHCSITLSARDVIGVGVHGVPCKSENKIIKEPFTFYIVQCPECELKGTVDSLMNKGDMMFTASQVWDTLIQDAWLQNGNSGSPTRKFITDRKTQSLDRFFTFTRMTHVSKTDEEE